MRDYILVYINGERFELRGEKAFLSLSDFLRYELGKTGTKVVCAEGDCGACTVLQGSIWEKTQAGKLSYKAINSCITFMYLLDASHLITIEGIEQKNELHPIQKAMMECHGAQCGFCTPGFVCAMTAVFEERLTLDKPIDDKKLCNGLTGNLCRCTGYESIIEAGRSVDISKIELMNERYHSPKMINELEKISKITAVIASEGQEVLIPTAWSEAINWKKNNPQGRIVSGSSDLGVLINKNKFTPTQIIHLNHIEELHQLKVTSTHVIVNARVTLHELEEATLKTHSELSRLIHIFASPQIKNTGTLVGNVANGSPIGDTLPALFVLGALVEIEGTNGKRLVDINKFYLGYRQLDIKNDELIKAIHIPLMKEKQELKLYKVSKRKDMDISAITLAASWLVEDGKISSMKLALGGVGPVVMRATKTELFFHDKTWEMKIFEQAGKILLSEITPISDVRGSKEYRELLAQNLLLKIYYETIDSELEMSL